VANFLSPRISQRQAVDPSINEFYIETEDPNEQFEEFLSFGIGSTVGVTDSNLSFLVSLARELNNLELYSIIYTAN
jgi:hypothetical protein